MVRAGQKLGLGFNRPEAGVRVSAGFAIAGQASPAKASPAHFIPNPMQYKSRCELHDSCMNGQGVLGAAQELPGAARSCQGLSRVCTSQELNWQGLPAVPGIVRVCEMCPTATQTYNILFEF